MRAAAPALGRAERRYKALMRRSAAHLIPTSVDGIGAGLAKDVSWSYGAHFRAESGGGRQIYNSIKARSEFCPICRFRPVSQLDHYLPRESYPALAIMPSNLVPSCSDCNGTKKVYVPTSSSDSFFHPYFDSLEGIPWLSCSVAERPGGPVRFCVDLRNFPDPDHASRVDNHFRVLGLPELYAAKASTHRVSMSAQLDDLSAVGGADAVARHLRASGSSWRKGGEEPWIAAALLAWADSAWFCSGGWRL